MKKIILAGFLTLLTSCTQQVAAPTVSYGSNYIKPGGSLGSTATFTTTVNNTLNSQAQVAFNNAISYGANSAIPIFAANTFYSCASATPATSLLFTVGSNVVGVNGNLNVPTGTYAYNSSVTFQIQN